MSPAVTLSPARTEVDSISEGHTDIESIVLASTEKKGPASQNSQLNHDEWSSAREEEEEETAAPKVPGAHGSTLVSPWLSSACSSFTVEQANAQGSTSRDKHECDANGSELHANDPRNVSGKSYSKDLHALEQASALARQCERQWAAHWHTQG